MDTQVNAGYNSVIHGAEMGEYATEDKHDSEWECEISTNVGG